MSGDQVPLRLLTALQLLERCKSQDLQALGEMIRRHEQWLQTWAGRGSSGRRLIETSELKEFVGFLPGFVVQRRWLTKCTARTDREVVGYLARVVRSAAGEFRRLGSRRRPREEVSIDLATTRHRRRSDGDVSIVESLPCNREADPADIDEERALLLKLFESSNGVPFTIAPKDLLIFRVSFPELVGPPTLGQVLGGGGDPDLVRAQLSSGRATRTTIANACGTTEDNVSSARYRVQRALTAFFRSRLRSPAATGVPVAG